MTGQNQSVIYDLSRCHQQNKALLFALPAAIAVDGRVGLFKTMELSEFQNWAIVEDTMKQELRGPEKDLWQIAGYIKETYHLIPNFISREQPDGGSECNMRKFRLPCAK